MECFYHKDVNAIGICSKCGKAVCRECAIEKNNKLFCDSCYKNAGLGSKISLFGKKDNVIGAGKIVGKGLSEKAGFLGKVVTDQSKIIHKNLDNSINIENAKSVIAAGKQTLGDQKNKIGSSINIDSAKSIVDTSKKAITDYRSNIESTLTIDNAKMAFDTGKKTIFVYKTTLDNTLTIDNAKNAIDSGKHSIQSYSKKVPIKREDVDAARRKVENELANDLSIAFDMVISERKKKYEKHPDKIPKKEDINNLIDNYAKINAGISGGISLAPGPWGMAAAIPEIIFIVKSQISMLYDIGVAYGHEKELDKKLLINVFVMAMGIGGIGVITMSAGQMVVKRASLHVIQELISLLAGQITQQLIKSWASKWVPILGAGAMATWSYYSTKKIGAKASSIFEKQFIYSDEEVTDTSAIDSEIKKIEDEILEEEYEEVTTTIIDKFGLIKVQSLINMLKMSKNISQEEKDCIFTVIENTEFSEQDKEDLLQSIDTPKKYTIDYTELASSPEEAITLITELISLSRVKGNTSIQEKMYIKQIGKLIGFSDRDIEELINVNSQAI